MCQFCFGILTRMKMKIRDKDKIIPDMMSMAGSYWLCCRYHEQFGNGEGIKS